MKQSIKISKINFTGFITFDALITVEKVLFVNKEERLIRYFPNNVIKTFHNFGLDELYFGNSLVCN